MSKIAEIRAQDAMFRTLPERTRNAPVSEMHRQRAYLLDLVARMRDCLSEFTTCDAMADDEQSYYVEIQVARKELADAKALCEEAKWYPEFTQRLSELIDRRRNTPMDKLKIELTLERSDEGWELTHDGRTYVYSRIKQALAHIERTAEALGPENVAVAAGGAK